MSTTEPEKSVSTADTPGPDKHHADSQGWHEHGKSRDDAQAANIDEHEQTVREALRAYPKAVAWSLIISLSIIQEGYDTVSKFI